MAFQEVNKAMTTAPILALANFSKPFLVELNSYEKGIGAVLVQEGGPLPYFSKVLTPRIGVCLHIRRSTWQYYV